MNPSGARSVWEAWDLELNFPRALRFLADSLVQDPHASRSLKTELTRLHELDHGGIAQSFEFFRDVNHAAIAMELVEGPSLKYYASRRTKPWFEVEDIRYWAAELCRALHYAHGQTGLVHGDLNPGNLLLTRDGHLKLAGFGLDSAIQKAMQKSAKDATELNRGEIEFLSPQMVEGKSAEIADDIYALGATLHEMLSGKPPFEGDGLVERILNEPAPSVTTARGALKNMGQPVPANWQAIIQSCLAKEPSQRPASVREIAGQLGLDLQTLIWREPQVPRDFFEAQRGDLSAATAQSSTSEDGAPRESAKAMHERRARLSRVYPISRHGIMRSGLARWSAAAALSILAVWLIARKESRGSNPSDSPSPLTQMPSQDPPAQSLAAVERFIGEKNWTAAKERLTQLRRDFPDYHEARLAEARILKGEDKAEAALKVLQKLLDHQPKHAEASAIKVLLLAHLQRHDETIPAAQWAVAQVGNAHRAELFLALGISLRATGYLSQAIRSLEHAKSLSPTNPEILWQMALAAEESNDFANAISHYSALLSTDPQNLLARQARGHAVFQQLAKSPDREHSQLYSMAAEDFGLVLDRSKNLEEEQIASLAFYRMQAYVGLKDWANVQMACGRLATHGSFWEKSSRPFFEQANAILKTSPVKETPPSPEPKPAPTAEVSPIPPVVPMTALVRPSAPTPVSVFTVAKPLAPPPSLFEMADTHLRKGDYSKAIAAYSLAAQAEPSNRAANAGRGFAYYRRGKYHGPNQHSKPADLRAALADFDRALSSRDQATPELYIAKAWSHFWLGEYKEASRACDKGLRRYPQDRHLANMRNLRVPQAIAAKKKRAAKNNDEEDEGLLDHMDGFLGMFNRAKPRR